MDLTVIFQSILESFRADLLPQSIQYVIFASPVLLAIILGMTFVELWIKYVRANAILATKRAVLEIKLPRENFKSPLAMELFLLALHNTADGNLFAQFWEGSTRPWFSLELVSFEGQVKMMLWVPEKNRNFIEANLYAQFPGIEVTAREDYTRSVHYDPETMKMWAGEFEFTKEDAYPIKTYVDYKLDKDPKEELKVDPIVPLIEFLGSVGPNQQIWIQFIIRAHKKDKIKKGHIFKKTDSWKDQAQDLINEIMHRDPKTKFAGTLDDETGRVQIPTLSKGEEELVTAISRSISKQAFDTGIRAIYVAQKDFFNPSNIGGIIGSFKHFSSEHLNGFKPGSAWMPSLEYPWQDFRDFRKNRTWKAVLSAYKRRSYFFPPYVGKPMIMNIEELATIFHFPGSVAQTPTLERVPSKKTQAPTNLPI